MRIKRVLSLVMALVIVFTMAGCGRVKLPPQAEKVIKEETAESMGSFLEEQCYSGYGFDIVVIPGDIKAYKGRPAKGAPVDNIDIVFDIEATYRVTDLNYSGYIGKFVQHGYITTDNEIILGSCTPECLKKGNEEIPFT